MIKVLALTDEANISSMFKSVVEKMTNAVHTINYTGNIKYIYQRYVPDIILLDLQMPGMDSGEVLRYLALHDSISSIVVMSEIQGDDVEATIRLGKSMGLGMVGVLTKPIEPDALKKILHKYLGITDEI